MTGAGEVSARPRTSRRSLLTSPAAAAVLLLIFFGVMESSLREKSVTFDELAHLTAGYSYDQYGDYRFQPENGVLPQRWEALPLILARCPFPSLDSPAWKAADEWSFGYQWLYRQGREATRMLAWGRGMAGLVTVALGALVWAWSRHLFGATAGMLSLLLYLLNPNILANGALITSDMSGSFFLLAALAGALWLGRKPTLGRALGSAVLTGCALVAKASGILILPVLLLLVAVDLIFHPPAAKARFRRLIIGVAVLPLYAVVSGSVVWAFYGFRYEALAPALASGSHLSVPWEILQGMPGARSWLGSLVAIARAWQLLPEAYLYGLLYVTDFSQYRSAFLNGAVSLQGWIGFFPYAFLVKNPIPVLIILWWSGILLVRGLFQNKPPLPTDGEHERRFEIAALLLFSVVYAAMALLSHLNIGQRHLLPLYGPFFILCGLIVRERSRPPPAPGWNRRPSFLLAGLVVVMAGEAVAWYPDYLAYFNLLAGGERGGYRHLVDSSLDWGQDLPGAARYIREHPEKQPFYLSYFGNGSPVYEGVNARLLYGVPGWDVAPLVKVSDRAGDPSSLPAPAGYEFLRFASTDPTRALVLFLKPSALKLTGGTYLISATMLQPVLYSPQDGPWGHWNWRDESIYRDLQGQVNPLLLEDSGARAAALSARSPGEWEALWSRFEQFRFARLTAFLRKREPVAIIGGGSILVYRVNDREVDEALDGPPAELEPDPKWTHPETWGRSPFNGTCSSSSPVGRSRPGWTGP